jgi:hypothetical protein
MIRRNIAIAAASLTLGAALSAGTLWALADSAPKAPAKAPEGFTDTPIIPGMKWHVHDPARPIPPVVTPGKTFSHAAPAPSDAVVLFDGTDLSRFQGEKGDPQWKVENGYVKTTKTGRIRTRDEFGDFQLHLEFATPSEVKGKGQGRGNNGVNIFGRYEIQILDSYDNLTYADGGCAAIYGQYPPLVNASRPPGEWQTYDIVWQGPRWDDAGNLTRKAAITVIHNGLVVHHKQELIGRTNWKALPRYPQPHGPRGYIELYEHGNPVRFRNIWIREMKDYDQQ